MRTAEHETIEINTAIAGPHKKGLIYAAIALAEYFYEQGLSEADLRSAIRTTMHINLPEDNC